MSSYRRLDASLAITDDVCDAVYPFRTVKGTTRAQIEPAKGCAGEETYKHRRKSAPANIPLTRTLKWANELPPRVRPVALMRQFPRIANLIAAAWEDLVQFEIYMDSLLTDKRGGRKGFPSDVIAELGALDIYRHTVQGCALPAIAWSDVGRRG
jgi:hypothetical protein